MPQPEIMTKRLRLRALSGTDVDVIARELNNFEVSRFTARVPYPYALSDAEDFVAWASGVDDRSLICAVELGADPGLLIGIISCEWSDEKNDGELGYWYAQSVWGQGIASEAAKAVVTHMFETVGHDRLVATYQNENLASARVLQKLGFEITGSGAHFSKAQDRDVDVTHLALTRTRWLVGRA
jgi:RimJ/RimL family protein N-acetyltransferase